METDTAQARMNTRRERLAAATGVPMVPAERIYFTQ
jgi:hypothetical protein